MEKRIFCLNHYLLVTPLNPKISFLFNAKIKNYFLISVSRLFFFFRTCFFYFVVDEWRNYFASVIGQYNRLLSKIGRFKTSGEFSITNSLKFDFSLFCRVLLLAFFSYLFLFRVVLFFSFISIPIYNWEAFSYFQRPTANII